MKPGCGPDSFERRRSARFRIAIPVELEEGTGITRDVSLSGVFFETDRSFAPGEQINLVMVLERVSPGRPVRLQCEGRVVRVTHFDRRMGVAVAISAYKFGPSGRLVGEA
ncbi:MAG: PilZ domain-containing protein [Candidatus Methylomirabilales bacterium]